MKEKIFFAVLFVLLSQTLSANAESFLLPKGLKTIEEYAFAGNTEIREIVIPDRVAAIGPYAFSGCDGLQRITIPESVKMIGQDAFTGCAEDLLIRTLPGSAAHSYALENGMDYWADTTYRALLIAQTYEDIPYLHLLGTENDAADIASCLSFFQETPYQTKIRVNLSKNEILDEIDSFFGDAEPWDVSLFYFAGHGVSSFDKEFQGALLGSDGKEYITGKQLRAALDQIPGRKIVITDSCYSGKLISSLTTDSASGSYLRAARSVPGAGDFVNSFTAAFSAKSRSIVSESGYYVLTAASENERSYEDLVSGQIRGLFSSRLVLGCGYDIVAKTWKHPLADANGNGSVTLDELYLYIGKDLSSEGQHVQVYPAECRWFGIFRFY